MSFPEFFLYPYLGFLLLSIPLCSGTDCITVGNEIMDDRGHNLVSAGGRFELGFFGSEGQRYIGIWYHSVNPQEYVWVANRDRPFFCSRTVLQLQMDGNLVISSALNGSLLLTNLESRTGINRTAQLLDSGNLVLSEIYQDGSMKVIWQSFDHPTNTLLPEMRTHSRFKLTSWKGPNDPATGDYVFEKDRERGGEFIIWKKSFSHTYPYWKTGISGDFIPDNLPFFLDVFLHSKQRRYGPYDFRLMISSDGRIKFFWLDGDQWDLPWSEPENPCRVLNTCGNFASCNLENKKMCQCLPGFEPQLPEKWNSGDFSGGCKRKSQICAGKDDTSNFLGLKMMRVGKPDRVIETDDEGQCMMECLSNCSCQAYAFTSNYSLPTDKPFGNCWTWMGSLNNMQENTEDGHDLYVRLPPSDIELKRRSCGTCGTTVISYPLSTGEHCGDLNYSGFSCDDSTGQVKFRPYLISYRVTGIDPKAHRFTIRAKDQSDCAGEKKILGLNRTSPFYLISNCNFLQEPWLKDIEIGWKLPGNPTCNSSNDCLDWMNTICSETSDGVKRCLCKRHFIWNSSTINCVPDAENNVAHPPHKLLYLISLVSVPIIVVPLGLFLYIKRSSAKRQGKKECFPENLAFRWYDSERRVKEWIKSGHFDEHDKKGIDVPFFDMEIIVEATNNFSDENKLGRGGFGPVYKGKFPGGQEIAVKRLLSSSGQGLEEFRNEVILIAKLQHRNLVRLLGYCTEGDEKMLLYEYMPNKSLDSFIFDRTRCALLTWEIRMEIILGITRGMLYLHHDSRLRIIHRDLKTSNVLLDEEMRPKISDFGLARIFEGKQTEASTNRVIGTYGYMSPEYALDGFFSVKSDVFSFGVVTLEIISAKRHTGFYQAEGTFNLLSHAWKVWNENNIDNLIDRALDETYNRNEALKCLNVALLCIQDDPSDRPTMLDVIRMLSNENVTLPVPKQPFFFSKSNLSGRASSSSKPESNNELSVTLEEGR